MRIFLRTVAEAVVQPGTITVVVEHEVAKAADGAVKTPKEASASKEVD